MTPVLVVFLSGTGSDTVGSNANEDVVVGSRRLGRCQT